MNNRITRSPFGPTPDRPQRRCIEEAEPKDPAWGRESDLAPEEKAVFRDPKFITVQIRPQEHGPHQRHGVPQQLLPRGVPVRRPVPPPSTVAPEYFVSRSVSVHGPRSFGRYLLPSFA